MGSSPLIYKKLIEIQKSIKAISKDRKNTFQNYSFRGVDEVYNEVHPLFSEHGVVTVPKVLEMTRFELPSKKEGVNLYSVLKIEFTFFAEDGSSVSVITVGEGMDSSDKASNKAMSVAHKYAIIMLFNIPTSDAKDPENESLRSVGSPVKAKPVAIVKNEAAAQKQAAVTRKANAPSNFDIPEDAGKYRVKFGKKFKGSAIEAIDKFELDSFLQWCHKECEKKGQQPSHEVAELAQAFETYLEQRNLVPMEGN